MDARSETVKIQLRNFTLVLQSLIPIKYFYRKRLVNEASLQLVINSIFTDQSLRSARTFRRTPKYVEVIFCILNKIKLSRQIKF